MITGKIRAWIEHCAQGVIVAFIAVSGEDNAPLKRPPGTRHFASSEEAKQWIEAEAQVLGVPIEWVDGGAPEANVAD